MRREIEDFAGLVVVLVLIVAAWFFFG